MQNRIIIKLFLVAILGFFGITQAYVWGWHAGTVIANQLRENDRNRIPALICSRNAQNFEEAKRLISYNEFDDVTKFGFLSSFFYAVYEAVDSHIVWEKQCDVLDYLASLEFDLNHFLNFPTQDWRWGDEYTNTPLTASIELRKTAFVTLLLHHKACPDSVDSNGRSPLERVIRQNNDLYLAYRWGKIDSVRYHNLNAADCDIARLLVVVGARIACFIRTTNWCCRTKYISLIDFASNPDMKNILKEVRDKK